MSDATNPVSVTSPIQHSLWQVSEKAKLRHLRHGMDCNSEHDVTPGMPETFEALCGAASVFFGELGAWSYETWASHNETYFDGKLKPGPILWGLTNHGRFLGFYALLTNSITLHTSLIRPSGDAWSRRSLLGERYASDVLLHEMIHQAIHQAGNSCGEPHNCKPWCREIVRISAMIGIPILAEPIRQKRVDGKVKWYVKDGHLTRAQIASWPHCVRPREFYEADTHELLKRNLQHDITRG